MVDRLFVVQVSVLCLLTFVVMFGTALVLDLLAHRWWAAPLVYVVLIGWLTVRAAGVHGLFVILLPVSALGVALASWGVRVLRDKGYRLFQESADKRR